MLTEQARFPLIITDEIPQGLTWAGYFPVFQYDKKIQVNSITIINRPKFVVSIVDFTISTLSWFVWSLFSSQFPFSLFISMSWYAGTLSFCRRWCSPATIPAGLRRENSGHRNTNPYPLHTKFSFAHPALLAGHDGNFNFHRGRKALFSLANIITILLKCTFFLLLVHQSSFCCLLGMHL